MTNSITKHSPIPGPYPLKGYFDYPVPSLGGEAGTKNRDSLTDFCRAIYYAGTTLYLWNKNTDLKVAFLSACAIKEGQTAFLISKYGGESGLTAALQSLIGESGSLTVKEIGQQAIDAFANLYSTKRNKLRWNFDYLDFLPDCGLDKLILFGAASHVADWDAFARQINRVLRDGGRVIIAETLLGGNMFKRATHVYAHVEGYIGKVLAAVGISEEELPDVTPEILTNLLKPYLSWSSGSMADGLFLFHGQKGGKEDSSVFKGMESTKEVEAFLTKKPSQNSWDYLAEPEKAVWSTAALKIQGKIEKEDPLKGIKFLGENLFWMWRNNRDITDIMWSNIIANRGYKVFVISEVCGGLGIMEELRSRVGRRGEIVYMDMIGAEDQTFKDWPERRKKYMEMGVGERWPYDWGDTYPDEYFDLLFLPQGVHHSTNWLRDAPRLLRTLKPGHQVMALECGFRPEHQMAQEMNALVKLIVERCSGFINGGGSHASPDPATLPPELRLVGRPGHDVSTAHLREAFGDRLYDVNSLEWKGWILFWGYKK
jgi:hypothetical protein